MSVGKPHRDGPQTLMTMAGAVALAGIVTTWSVTLGSKSTGLPRPSPPAEQPGSASIRNGVVRITGKLNDVTRTGTGFVVARDTESVTVVTSAHVVRQLPEFEVVFAASPTRRYSIDEVVAIDVESLHGLAVFTLLENVPSAVRPLDLDRTASPQPGDRLSLWGYPQASVNPSTLGRGLANREGLVYTMDSRVPEGMSGGPVVLEGRVVALTSRTDEQLSYAVPASVVVEFLEGYGIELTPQGSTPQKTAAQPSISAIAPATREVGNFSLTISGGSFDPAKVQIVVLGPGCGTQTACVVPNAVLTSKTATQVVAPMTLGSPGSYAIHVQNGPSDAVSNGATLTVTAAPPPPPPPVFRMGPLTSGLVFVGADIFNPAPKAASAPACSVLCMNNAECQAMSFDTNTGECWLKRAAKPHNQPVGNYVSAIKERVR